MLHTRNVAKTQNYRVRFFSTKQLHMLILCTFSRFDESGFDESGLNQSLRYGKQTNEVVTTFARKHNAMARPSVRRTKLHTKFEVYCSSSFRDIAL